MRLAPTPEEVDYREEVRAWLLANVPGPLPAPDSVEGINEHRKWEQELYRAGYAAVHWPTEYGGRGLTPLQQAMFEEEYIRAGAPKRVNFLGLYLAGPTLMQYGTESQKNRWLPDILECKSLWSQGFSEPDAGSDLASLATRAVRSDEGYRVTGRKVWTTLGPFADWAMVLVRTDPEAPKHRGISMLMVDMKSPGIEVRPIKQMNGDSEFSEVYFDDVRVPTKNLVGTENGGWRVALSTLGFERGTGPASYVRFEKDVEDLKELIRALGLAQDGVMRDRLAALYIDSQVYRFNSYRMLIKAERGDDMSTDASVNKLFWSEMETRIYEAGLDALDKLAEVQPSAVSSFGVLDTHSTDIWAGWEAQYWYARACRIAAGTNEVQKDIIARRVLGLPRSA